MQAAQPMRVDWFQVIADISRHGYSTQSLADAVAVPKSTLLGWKQGAEPRYSEGERLVAFWCQQTCRERALLPMVGPDDWWAYHARAK